MRGYDLRFARPILIAGSLLGVGMGALVDGILFHQVFQLHNMVSAQRPPTSVRNIEVNMVWDGVFHAFAWSVTLLGIIALFRAGKSRHALWKGSTLTGAMLFGWGMFNCVEGVMNHHVLHLHHVVEQLGPSVYDWLFLASGVLLMAGGALFVRSSLRLRRVPMAVRPIARTSQPLVWVFPDREHDPREGSTHAQGIQTVTLGLSPDTPHAARRTY